MGILGAILLMLMGKFSLGEEAWLSSTASSLDISDRSKSRGEKRAEEQRSEKISDRPPGDGVLATAGEFIKLKVFSDGTFQMHLADPAGEIWVRKGTKLFAYDDLPEGVAIKIMNGAGEIFTDQEGYKIGGLEDPSWYRPSMGRIEMPIFSTRDPVSGKWVPAPQGMDSVVAVADGVPERRSPRVSLAELRHGLSPKIRRQSGLQFKLGIFPSAMQNALSATGQRLDDETFPPSETDWLDGALLFDHE